MTGSDQSELRRRYKALIYYAQNILKNSPYVKNVEPQYPSGLTDTDNVVRTRKVCIIGGGIGGLYAAMLLQDLGIPFDVMEADNRFGGRTFTHRFSDNPEDHYDAGALCFPEMPVTKSLFKLIDKLDLRNQLIGHALEAENNTLLYNSVLKKRSDHCVTAECFDFPNIPPEYSEKGWPELVNNAIKPFEEKLINGAETESNSGYEMMTKYDMYSVRAYLSSRRSDTDPDLDKLEKMPYPSNVVNWCETFDRTIGRYSDALTERVIERLALAFPSLEHVPKEGSDVTCYRINGGSSVIIEKMLNYLEKNNQSLNCGSLVRKIAYREDDSVEVTILRGSRNLTRVYDHVITTTTLPCLYAINLQGAELGFERSYTLRSTKRAWWEDPSIMTKVGVIKEGQSFSDRMASAIIYTSPHAKPVQNEKQNAEYVIDISQTGNERPRMLISSQYSIFDPTATVTNSSQFKNPFPCEPGIGLSSPIEDNPMRQMILRDLALSHGLTMEQEEKVMELFLEGYTFSWDIHPFTMGAFPRFGPGQFVKLYENLTHPAARGRLHFAGGAASIQHSWISGTLSASRRAVEEILYFREKKEDLKKLTTNWGEEEEWDGKIIKKQVQIARHGAKQPDPI